MSIERALTALESIATALTALAAYHAPADVSITGSPAGGVATSILVDKTQNADKPAATEKKTRTRPEIAKATGIKVEDQAAALIVAKALVGNQKGETEADGPEPMDYEILKRAVLEVGSYSEQGRSAVIKMLGDYGVKNAKEIAPEKREEFHGKLIAVLTDLQNDEVNTEDEFA